MALKKKILESEIKHEETNYSPVDSNDLKQFKDNTKFQFIDKENSLNMELRKTQGNFEVIVNFQAKAPVPQENEPQQEQEEKMPENMNEFFVRIVKKGSKNGLLVSGTTIDTSFECNQVIYGEDINSLYEDYMHQKAADTYTGPEFTSLDERLQSEFSDFFSSLGINEELMTFMNVLSVDKDQRLYLGWLKNVNKFISH